VRTPSHDIKQNGLTETLWRGVQLVNFRRYKSVFVAKQDRTVSNSISLEPGAQRQRRGSWLVAGQDSLLLSTAV